MGPQGIPGPDSGGLYYLPLTGSTPMTGPLTLSGNATSALHAVPLQQLNAAVAGGPFLSLSGGNVTGATDFGATIQGTTFETYNHRIQTGGTLNTALGIYGDLSGIKTGGNPYFATINLLNDTLDAGGAGISTLRIRNNSGGAVTTGNRTGLYIDFNFTGGPTNKARGIGSQYGGQWTYATASGNVGGTAGPGNAYGTLWGGISSATLASGATFWNASIGHEVNFGVSTGASAPYAQGIKIVLAHHNQAVNPTDFMLGLAKYALTDVGLGNGIAFGSPDGYWPIDASGTLIGSLASLLATPPAMTAAYGVDFNAVTFSGAAFRSTGFAVSPSGIVTAAGGTLTGGINWGSNWAASTSDLSKHISLYANAYGISATSGAMNFNAGGGGAFSFLVSGVSAGYINNTGLNTMSVGQQTAAPGTFTTLTAQWAIAWPLPSVKTGTSYACNQFDVSLILNPTGPFTITLPSVTPVGRVLLLKLVAAFAVTSASSNVVPMIGGAASNAIMPATAGKYCQLQSDGTAWQIMMAN